ncbi:MAG: hypothetical protein ACP5H2_03860 [Solirubrobacteraceae bacterium]
MFWEGVAQDVVADLLSAAALGSLTVAAAYWRFSGHFDRLRQFLHPALPTSQVVVAAGPDLETTAPQLNEQSPFRSPITPAERDRLVDFYQRVSRTTTWNGRVVRLDRLEPTLELSVVEFWDLVATNLTAYFASTSVLSLPASISAMYQWVRLRQLINKVVSAARPTRRHLPSAAELLANSHLANVAGVAVLVSDPSNRCLITQHQRNRITARDAWFPTAIGTVEAADLDSQDPFRHAALRILDHYAHLTPASLTLQAVVLPDRNLQPYFCFSAIVDRAFEELVPDLAPMRGQPPASGLAANAAGYKLLDIADPGTIVRFCRTPQQSQTAAYLLWQASSAVVGEDALLRAWRHRFLRALDPRRVLLRRVHSGRV